jgi:hypothetical protein
VPGHKLIGDAARIARECHRTSVIFPVFFLGFKKYFLAYFGRKTHFFGWVKKSKKIEKNFRTHMKFIDVFEVLGAHISCSGTWFANPRADSLTTDHREPSTKKIFLGFFFWKNKKSVWKRENKKSHGNSKKNTANASEIFWPVKIIRSC